MQGGFIRYIKPIIPLSLIIFAGCGGGGGGGSDNPLPKPINTAPKITILSPTSSTSSLDVTKSKTLAIKAKVDDADGGNVTLVATWDGGSVNPSQKTVSAGSTVDMTFTAPDYNGTCEIYLSANDGDASDSEQLHVNVTGNITVPDTLLKITNITMTPSSVKPGESANLSATISNPSGKTVSYKWICLDGSISGSNSNAVWKAPKTPGIYGVYLEISDGSGSVRAGIPATVNANTGSLLGEYYKTDRNNNHVSLASKVFSQLDPGINFNWMDMSPDMSKLPADGFGVKWTGYIKAEEGGDYQFRVHVDDGAKLKVMDDNNAWVNIIPDTPQNWTDHDKGAWLPSSPVSIHFQGGKWYPIELQYFEGGGNAFITLYWSINGGIEVIVPQSVLKPPSGS